MSDYSKQNPQSIEFLFNHIADSYDRANSWMSWNLHKRWNEALCSKILQAGEPACYLDLCSGTGEIAFRLLSNMQTNSEAFLLDFSENMLRCAQAKAANQRLAKHKIHYLRADAQKIPLEDRSVDAVTLAYGIRNIENPEACVQEIFRVLKPGGRCVILELTRPANRLLRLGHQIYTSLFLPIIGRWVASDRRAYAYLKNSIQAFLAPEQLEAILQRAGFQKTSVEPLNGGIATLFVGNKGL